MQKNARKTNARQKKKEKKNSTKLKTICKHKMYNNDLTKIIYNSIS